MVRAGDRTWDVVIAGAGPAGLSAALILGRCLRRVLLCDTDTPRSWAAMEMHGFLSRDGTPPDELRELAHRERARYDTVQFRRIEVTGAVRRSDDTFDVQLKDAPPERSRTLLIATGVIDLLPDLPDIESFFGISVHTCPYCDGWEVRGAPIAVYGRHTRGFEMARALTAWSADLVLCTDGLSELSGRQKNELRRNGIELIETRIERLLGSGGRLEALRFVDGRTLARKALFFDTPSRPQSALVSTLGCEMTGKGGIRVSRYEMTSVPGVFVAGNILRDVQLSIVAAAEGAKAAFGINRALTREDFGRAAEMR